MTLPAVLATVVLGLIGWPAVSHAEDLLQIAPPSKWTGGWKQDWDGGQPGWRLTTYKPEGADPKSPRHLISITHTWGAAQQDGLQRLTRAWGLHIKTSCPGMYFVPGRNWEGNGFTVGYAQFYCPKRSDTGEGSVDFVKAFASASHAYLVAVARRTPPFTSTTPGMIQYADNSDTEALVQWLKDTSDYLQKVRACSGPSRLELACSP